MMKTPVLPVLLGLTLCGIGSAMLYVYFKSKGDEEETTEEQVGGKHKNTSSSLLKLLNSSDAPTPQTKAIKKSAPKPPVVEEKDVVYEMLICNSIAPMVVGRNSSNLKLLEEQCAAKIWFKDKEDGKNQICCIKAKPDNVKKCEEMIKTAIKRANHVTEEIFVPQTACGKIMGRCGDALQEICRKSKAKVSVESGDRGDGKIRKIIITGNQQQVNIAKVLIEEKVKEDIETRKLIDEVEAKREPRGGVRTPTSLTPASSRESIPPRSEKLSSTSSDGQLEVYVSAIASPARFWLQLVGPQSSDLDNLVQTMTEYYSKTENQELHKIREPYLGQIVAAMFKYDSKWYRAEVISILPNEYKAGDLVLDLYFVDYGDSEFVGTHEVCELRTDFLMLRFQAIECYLANVQPAIGQDSEIWDEQSIARFEQLTHVAQWKKMVSRTVTYKERIKGDTRIRREGSPVPGVELYDFYDGRDINVADELVGEGYALYTEEAQQARNTILLSYDSPGSSQSSSVYEILPNGHTSSTTTTNNINTLPLQTNNQTNDSASTKTRDKNDNSINSSSSNNSFNDKFSAIYENTTNENYENIKRDTKFNGRQTNQLFLETERNEPNGNVGTVYPGTKVNDNKKLFPKDWNEMIDEQRREQL